MFLADPAEARGARAVRPPSASYGRKTALVRSRRVLKVTANFLNTSVPNNTNDGRFSILCQAIPGNVDRVSHYQDLVVDTSAGWPLDIGINFDQTAAYLPTALVQMDDDPRLDRNWFQMFGPAGGRYESSATGGPNPLSTNLINPVTYNLPLTITDPGPNYVYVPYLSAPPSWTAGLKNFGTDLAQLPVGTWNLELRISGLLPADGEVGVAPFDPRSGTVISVQDYAYDGLSVVVNLVVTVPLSSSTPFDTSIVIFNNSAPMPVTEMADLTVEPTFPEFKNLANPHAPFLDGHLVQNMRPAAMSCWFQATSAPIYTGGEVVAAFLTSDSCSSGYYTRNPDQSPGQLQEWENLSQTPRNCRSKFNRGVYTWWSQEDVSDFDFYSPDACNAHDFPCLSVAGVCALVNSGLVGQAGGTNVEIGT
jgi:hypothetical protein